MRTLGLLVFCAAMAGCHGGSEPPPPEASPPVASPLVVAPPGAAIAPLALDKSDPKAPRQLPPDSPLARLTVEEVADRLPAFAGARVLDAPSQLGGADFVVQTSACLPPGSRVEAALQQAGWSITSSEPAGERTSIEAARAPYLLSATTQVGVDPRCDRKSGELLVELVLRKHR